MSVAVRVFVVSDNHSVQRFPAKHFERMSNFRDNIRFPLFAGKKIRFAACLVRLVDRKPVEVLHSDYLVLKFDEEGFLDRDEWNRGMRLAVESINWSKIIPRENHPKVIDLRSRFFRATYQREYTWNPTNGVRSAILTALYRSRRT